VILITGANGFIGSSMMRRLTLDGVLEVVGAIRSSAQFSNSEYKAYLCGELSPQNDWSQVLTHVSTVVHTAARVHVMKDPSANPLGEYRRANVEGTLNLARQAAREGVRRFIFISSVKVNGESTPVNAPFSADDIPAPQDPYGISKLEAEQGLRDIAQKTNMEVVVVRPPLVYGPGVKANFRSIMRGLYRGIPLPLGAVHNLRSFVALDNLVDLLVRCLTHPAAANQTFLVSDGEDLSTGELAVRLGRALGKSARLIPVSEQLLIAGATLLGRREFAQRICGSLRVDMEKTRRMLSWQPPITVNEGLRRAAEGFLLEARL
jgi:nucleoside-diphosphate-sugar epimerase